MIAPLVFLLLLCGLVSAANWDVQVAPNGMLQYDPPTVAAQPGDTVTFHFNPKAHSVTQSAFSTPCQPLAGGFDTQLIPVNASTVTQPAIVFEVEDTDPKWFYCKQQGPPIHCQQGMVFAINPPTDPNGNTFAKFQAAAQALAGASSTTSATTTTWTPPPSPVVSTVTVTVTAPAGNVYTTTYASWEGSPANPTPAAVPATHTIQVGATGLVFDPPSITASIDDIITFNFHAKAHSASQSTFNSPCELKDGGFDSGLMPVAADATSFPSFNITVNDTAPIWVFCKQQGPPIHCQQGMVFAVNAPTSGPNTFSAFQDFALHVNATSATSSGSNSTGGSPPPQTGKNGAMSVGVGIVGTVIISLAGVFVATL